MRSIRVIVVLSALIVAVGCSSTTARQDRRYEGPKLPKPTRILIYDFAASQADIPKWAAGVDHYAGQEQATTAEVLAEGRKLGAQVAKNLVAEIQAMGLPAQEADAGTEFQAGD
jgi:hypothetical protein